MKAIIFSTKLNGNFGGLEEYLPSALVPLVDRPLVQHVVEMLTDQGITQFEFFLSHLPEEVEAFLGTGERWGCRFQFHVIPDESEFYQSLNRLELLPEENLIIGHTDSLPVNGTIKAIRELPQKPVLISCSPDQRDAKHSRWTGWAGVPAEIVPRLFRCRNREEVETMLIEEQAHSIHVPSDSILRLDSPETLLEAQRLILSRTPPDLLSAGRELKPKVRFGRQTRIHSSAQIEGPGFLGEKVQVGRNVVVGPNSVIGRNCVLDDGCSVRNSIVMPNTYVGRDVDLENSLAGRRFLVNAQHGAGLEIEDSFILGDLKEGSSRGQRKSLLSRFLAAVALLALSPVLLLTALILRIVRGGPILHRWNAVTRNRNGGNRLLEFERFSFLPAQTQRDHIGFRLLLLDRLPSLINVFRGEMEFVGPKPKSLAEIDLIPPSWRDLYLEARPGIISEAELILGPDAESEEVYAVEAFYSVTRHRLSDLRLVLHYISKSLLGKRLAV